MSDKLRLGVLASGRGSNLQSIIDASLAGKIDAEVAIVISDKSDAFALERAAFHGIPAVYTRVGRNGTPEYSAGDEAEAAALREHGVGLVCLAGYMRMVGPAVLGAFPGAVMNIHPALLPAFPGVEVQWDAVEYGVRVAGCTVHFADEEFDRGPIIIQAAVPVVQTDDGEALAQRILRFEHRIYPQAIQWFAAGRLRLDGRRVVVEGAGEPVCVDGGIISPPLEIDI
jgi:phosphoribosylglycinamide formyltransferase-1